MKAVGYFKNLPIEADNALVDIELAQPIAKGHDLLVKIAAVAVNPVDYKVRLNMPANEGEAKVLGWDAVGEVIATGEKVSQFKPGDTVFYAGDLNRQGSNAEFQLVHERIVGYKPKSLSNAEAAALPLTAITAWELLFEHLGIEKQTQATDSKAKDIILVTGAAGGVGSIFIQLAKTLTNATVIATASRASSQAWVNSLGADYVIDHTKPLVAQIDALNIGKVTHVASLNSTESYFEQYVEMLAPFGKIGLIDDPKGLDVSKIKPKSLSLHFEFMFARSMHQADDMIEQSKLLNQVSDLIDQDLIKTTVGKNLGNINAANLTLAHQELESGTAIGKIVLEGF